MSSLIKKGSKIYLINGKNFRKKAPPTVNVDSSNEPSLQ